MLIRKDFQAVDWRTPLMGLGSGFGSLGILEKWALLQIPAKVQLRRETVRRQETSETPTFHGCPESSVGKY